MCEETMAKRKRKSSKTGAFGNPKPRRADAAQSGRDSALASSRDYVIRAMDRTQSGDINGALSDAEQAVKLSPKDGDAYLCRGSANAAIGLHKEAIVDFTKALRCPNNSYFPRSTFLYLCHWDRADSKAELGKHADAIDDYDRAIALNPKYPEAHFYRGISNVELGNHAGAITDCDRAIALKPKYAEAHYCRGRANFVLGNYAGAITDYGRAIAQSTACDSAMVATAWYNIGLSKIYLGDPENAIADFDHFIDLAPGDPDGYYRRGICRIHRGDWDDAIADFIETKSLNPDLSVKCYSWIGFAKGWKQDYHGALEAYGCSLALNLDFVPVYYNRGVTEALQGNHDSAIGDFNRVLELDPEHAGTYLQLGSVKATQGDYDGAIAYYNQAMALDPDVSSTCYVYRAVANLRKDDDQAAKDDCELAGIHDVDALLATELGRLLYSLTEPTAPVTSGEPPASDTGQLLELAEEEIAEKNAKIELLQSRTVEIEQEAEAAKEQARMLKEQLADTLQQMSLAYRHLPKGDYEQGEPKTTITSAPPYQVHYYTDSNNNDPFNDWLGQIDSAEDQKQFRDAIRLMEQGSLGDHKALRGKRGLFECRRIAPGLRIYFSKESTTSLLILAGGIKDKTDQNTDINKAMERLADHKRRHPGIGEP